MKDAVIGRMKIDNYLLSLMYETGGTLIDATYRVTAVHLGLDGYMEKRRYGSMRLFVQAYKGHAPVWGGPP